MRNLWHTTASLLGKYPILWLPALLAEALSFTIHWYEHIFQRWLTPQLVLWQSQAHSVFSNSPTYANPTQHGINHILLLLTPLEWGTGYLSDLIFACALVATASMLRTLAETRDETLHAAFAAITASRRRILIFALKVFALGLIGRYLLTRLTISTLNLQNVREMSAFESLKFQLSADKLELPWTFAALAVALCIAFVIAPIAVKLLQPPNSTLTPQQTNHARFATCTAIAAGTVLQFLHALIQAPFPPLRAGSASTFTIILMTVLILAIPNAPLYIAYSLIANPECLITDQTQHHTTDDSSSESIA